MEQLNESEELRFGVLAAHDLFTRLRGNPYIIKAFAAFYDNPFVERADLTGIYNRLLSLDDRRNSEILEMEENQVKTQAKGIEAYLKFLNEQHSPDDMYSTLSLFYFLGCFEMGINEEALCSIWPAWE